MLKYVTAFSWEVYIRFWLSESKNEWIKAPSWKALMVSSQECERTNPDALRRKLRRELLSGLGCDINRKLLQLVKTNGSCSAFATESVQLCSYDDLTAGSYRKTQKAQLHRRLFCCVSSGFGQSSVQCHCAPWLARSKPSLWALFSLICLVSLLATCLWPAPPFLPSFTETYRSVKALNWWLLLPCVLFTDAS